VSYCAFFAGHFFGLTYEQLLRFHIEYTPEPLQSDPKTSNLI
jgi:hypothetical protein